MTEIITPSSLWQGTPVAGSRWTLQQINVMRKHGVGEPDRVATATIRRVPRHNLDNYLLPPVPVLIPVPRLAITRDKRRAKVITPPVRSNGWIFIMADFGLVKRLVDAGVDREAAVAQVDGIVAAIVAQLLAGKSVALEGVGTLKAPETVKPAPFPPGKLRKERKVGLRAPAVIEAGEPFDDLRPASKKRRYFGNGIMA